MIGSRNENQPAILVCDASIVEQRDQHEAQKEVKIGDIGLLRCSVAVAKICLVYSA
jgi:hypothetical protein